jgi:hypothetical protein
VNAKKPGFENGIDAKLHPDLEDLLKLVRFAEEWRQEVELEADPDWHRFLPMTTYEDLVWMCTGTYVLANRYCGTGVDFKIHLGRCGTDCCEYRFGNLKGRFTHRLTVANANLGCHMADNVVNASAFNLKACGNNTCGAAIASAPLRRQKK